MENKHNVIIVGSGPSGYTAAIYAARANMNPIVITGIQPGGQLTTTTEVENFPGYPEGITGPEMMKDLEKQAQRFGTEVLTDMVTKVEFDKKKGGIHTVTTGSGKVYKTKSVIISTGASAKYLGKEFETKYNGGGVSACATCDGFFYKGKEVIVVGAGDTASEEAIYLSKLCTKVYLVIRKDYFKASKLMEARVRGTENIKILFNSEIENLEGANFLVERAIIKNNKTNETTTMNIDGVFIAIGHKPNTDLFVGALDMDETGYLKVKPFSTETNIPGVFAAGDVADSKYRQAITAAGTGCMSALDAERYLADIE